MATLPDLDTSTVSYVAYWNAIDQGGLSDIDPTDVTSSSRVISYELYDNGVEIEVSAGLGTNDYYDIDRKRNIKARVKNDGWFVCYVDESSYGFEKDLVSGNNVRSSLGGPYDAFTWEEQPSGDPLDTSELFATIESLQAELSTAPQFGKGEIGLYNYNTTSASTCTAMSFANNNDDNQTQVGFSYTSGTTRYTHVYCGVTYGFGNVTFEGETVASEHDNNNPPHFGVIDLLASSRTPDAGVEYVGDVQDGQYSNQVAYNIALWA